MTAVTLVTVTDRFHNVWWFIMFKSFWYLDRGGGGCMGTDQMDPEVSANLSQLGFCEKRERKQEREKEKEKKERKKEKEKKK